MLGWLSAWGMNGEAGSQEPEPEHPVEPVAEPEHPEAPVAEVVEDSVSFVSISGGFFHHDWFLSSPLQRESAAAAGSVTTAVANSIIYDSSSYSMRWRS